MRLCKPDGCAPYCDFCKHFRYRRGTDEGRCTHPRHPGLVNVADTCDDFHCIRAEGKEGEP